jgi:hypothetical protein
MTGGIYGRTICIDGTIWDDCLQSYRVGWRPAGSGGPFQPVDPGNPVYTGSKINQTVATWDTIGEGIPDGDYELRIGASSTCGFVVETFRTITVDNTAPVAEITQPENCQSVDINQGQIRIFGTAFDENLAGWVLQYTGGPTNNWVTIASGNTNVVNDLLGIWDFSNLPACCYTIRLVVTDQAVLNCNPAINHRTEFEVSLSVGEPCRDPGDINGDGVVNAFDIAPFIDCVTMGGCP